MTSHMPLSTVHIEIDIDSNADELFSYFTNWSSFRAVGFPFAKFVNLPDGKMVTGQELDLVARYFIFFTQTVYSNIIKIDPATRVWESYAVVPDVSGIHSSGTVSPLSATKTRLREQLTFETQDDSIIATYKYFRKLQHKRVARNHLRSRETP